MYRSGDLQIEDTVDPDEDYNEGLFFVLPHSCNDWVIGDLEAAKLMYKELGEKIDQEESRQKV